MTLRPRDLQIMNRRHRATLSDSWDGTLRTAGRLSFSIQRSFGQLATPAANTNPVLLPYGRVRYDTAPLGLLVMMHHHDEAR